MSQFASTYEQKMKTSAVGVLESCGVFVLHPSSTPAGRVSFAEIQQAGLQRLCIILEALSEGADQACGAALIFNQFHFLPWKRQTGFIISKHFQPSTVFELLLKQT